MAKKRKVTPAVAEEARLPGRPKGEESRRLFVEINPELRDKLDEEVRAEGRSLRKTVERILEHYFANKPS